MTYTALWLIWTVMSCMAGFCMGVRHSGHAWSREVRRDPRQVLAALITVCGKERLRRLLTRGVPL